MEVQNKGTLNEVTQQRGVSTSTAGMLLVGLVMLAVDDLNPVKNLCNLSSGVVKSWHVAYFSVCGLFVLSVTQAHMILYFLVKLFFRSTINHIFFRSVEIVGAENLPKLGPVILTGNHNNQFVDGAILLTNCRRKISFMIAEKSWKRPLVGFMARVFHAIPVSRPQDTVKTGAGIINLDGTKTVTGRDTLFSSQVTPGSQLVVKGGSGQDVSLKVHEVISDTKLILVAETPKESNAAECKYKILPKVDQSSMYEAVFQCLGEGKCLGIFPEGGSHDRTDLLPLKAGVAIIALEAGRKQHVPVPIVPVGLNYFRGHHFRGRVVVEFGAAINIEEELYDLYEKDKRKATESLLKIITTGMRSTIVPVPDYFRLQFVYMVRRLYQPDGLKLSNVETMDLNRRFAEGMRRLGSQLQRHEGQDLEDDDIREGTISESLMTSGKSPEELREFYDRLSDLRLELMDYMETLKRLGIRDHQVMQIQWWGLDHLVGRLFYVTLMLGLGIIPQLLFNLPVGIVARAFAASEQKKALKGSSVKLAARDVLMSYKIIYCLMLVPALYIVYIGVLLWFRGWRRSTLLLTLAMPVFSFFGVKASEQGIRAYADIVPLIRRLSPASRQEQDKLPGRRASLQKKVRSATKSAGPLLGNLYSADKIDWQKEIPDETEWPDWPAESEVGGRSRTTSQDKPRSRTTSRAESSAEEKDRKKGE